MNVLILNGNIKNYSLIIRSTKMEEKKNADIIRVINTFIYD